MKFNINDIFESEDLEILGDLPSQENLLNDLSNQASTKLADIVISFRYLGLFKDLSVAAMQELSKRRDNGDTFQFEKYIEDNIKILPKLDFNLPNLEEILKGFGKIK